MNSLLYYYNNVQKMAAYRQAKRMQRGALTAQGGFSTTDPALRQVPCTIQCVFVPKNVISAQQTPFTTSTGAVIRVDLLNGSMIIYLGSTTPYNQPYEIGSIYNIVFSVSPDQVNLYVNGELKKTLDVDTSQLSIYRIGFFNFNYYLQGDYLLHRHFNYAMSADEVKALDNNGDPMGYVVPKESRYFEKRYQSDFADGTDGWGSANGSPNLSVVSNGGILELSGNYDAYQIMRTVGDAPKYASKYKVRIELEERISLSSFLFYPFSTTTFVVGSFSEPTDVLEGVTNKPSDILSRNCYLYIYGLKPNDLVRIKSISVEPIGLIAEYLPQNLMYSKDDKAIATSWLDSAKQMPLSDEYMEPLFQSIGGYDMAANGAPEILYNE
jgi:hypothetical protein